MNRRWLWLILVIVAAVPLAIGVRYVYKKRLAAANAAAVHAALLKYSQNLKPGLTRKEVKDYLLAQGVGFMERCCYERGGPFSVLVQVGKEYPPWFCGGWPDYVAFEFAATEPTICLSSP